MSAIFNEPNFDLLALPLPVSVCVCVRPCMCVYGRECVRVCVGRVAAGSQQTHINSLAPGKFEWNFRHVIFKHILMIDGWGIYCEIALI